MLFIDIPNINIYFLYIVIKKLSSPYYTLIFLHFVRAKLLKCKQRNRLKIIIFASHKYIIRITSYL